MRKVEVPTKAVTAFGSTGVAASAVARVEKIDGAAVDVITFAPGALLGRHPNRLWQLFVLISGAGWVSGSDGVPAQLEPGEGVLWEPGEVHESGSDQERQQ